MKSFHKVDKAMAKLRKEYYQVKSDAMDAEVKRSELDRLMKRCVHLRERALPF